MKKRIAALIMSVLLIMLTFVSCSSSKKSAVNISGAEIADGIYTYYYDLVLSNKEAYGIKEDDKDKVKEKVIELLKEYVAVNTMAQQLNISLSYTLKAQTASETDARWDLFGNYYSDIGLTKQDLNKILTNSALKSALLEYYYGEDSKIEPTTAKELKKAFEKKYVGINVIAASLTTTDNLGNNVSLDEFELENIRTVFSNMNDRLNSGADINEVYSDYITNLDLIGTQSLETYIMTESSVGYGEDFFEKISALGYNTALVFEHEDTIYLVYRVDITGDDLGYFFTYKSAVLEDLCMAKLDKKIADLAETYELKKENSSVTKKLEEKVDKKHNKN